MESNHQPSAYQTDALPVELRAYEVGAEGIAPPTSRVLAGRSSSLSYAPSSRCAVVKVHPSWTRSDSNRQPPGCKSGALPLRATGPSSRRRDSNPQPPDPKSGALPLRHISLEQATGLEPASSRWHGDVLVLCTTPTRLFSCSRTGGRDRTPACWVGASRAPTTPRPHHKTKRKGPLLREEDPLTGRESATSSRSLRSAGAASPHVDPDLERARRRRPRYRGAASSLATVSVSSFPRS